VQLGYAGLFIGVLLENAGLPIPGETALLTAAGFAASGRLSLPLVIATAAVAAIIGDNLGFALARNGGQPLLNRYGPSVGITPERMAVVDRFYARWGALAVVVARFIAGIRVVAALGAGLSGMRWRVFLVANAVGALLWASVMGLVGYTGGSAIRAAAPYLVKIHFAAWALAVAAIVVTLAIAWWHLHEARNDG
jgi:membrane protein DedA with SNARE-associated domain